MKHYTSTELIKLMDEIGFWYDGDSSYDGYIVFHGSDDGGWSVFPISFSTWAEVAEWYHDYKDNL